MEGYLDSLMKETESYQTLLRSSKAIILVWAVISLLAFIWIILSWKYCPEILGQPPQSHSVITDHTKNTTVEYNNNQITEHPLNTEIRQNKHMNPDADDTKYYPSPQLTFHSNLDQKSEYHISNYRKSHKKIQIPHKDQQPPEHNTVTRVLRNLQQLLHCYLPTLAISVINMITLRSWIFNLAILIFCLLMIIIINLIARNMVLNKWLKGTIQSLWFFVSLLFYLNFWLRLF